METLINTLTARYPELRYQVGRSFYWSPKNRVIYYKASARGKKAKWSLLHETGHAVLNHQSYALDFELIQMEMSAWQWAARHAKKLLLAIDEDHIQDCIDTYRDWLFGRSVCPNCNNRGSQQKDPCYYHCFNCGSIWRVTPSRFCRAYRMRGVSTTSPAEQIYFV